MVFNRVSAKEEKGFTIGTLFARRAVAGQVGIEVEVEGKKLPYPSEEVKGTSVPVRMPKNPNWSYVHDGSLRGEENAEYIFTQPLVFSEVEGAVNELWSLFREKGSTIDDSNRTSVHVHLNMQNFHLNRVASFCALYFAVEEVLTEWCGEHRVGNLFCLRAKDAPAIVTQIKRFIKDSGAGGLADGLHYSALNAHSLQKHGSMEIRTLRGVSDPRIICDWVSILERIYTLSGEFNDPREICERFSSEGPESFFDFILGDKAALVRQGITNSHPDYIRECMYEGIRLAQDICYCRDWSIFKGLEVQPDPFGRSLKKVINSMNALNATPVPVSAGGVSWAELSPAPPPVSGSQASLMIDDDYYDEEFED